jgi:hypothetical protein
MNKLRDILESKSIDQIKFFVVEELKGSKIAWRNEAGDITELFISPAMMQLLDDGDAILSDILKLSDAIGIQEAPAYTVNLWKSTNRNIQQPTVKELVR